MKLPDGLQPGACEEVQLTDGIARLLAREPVHSCEYSGARYDCGTRLAFLEATLVLAAQHPELGSSFRLRVTELARQLSSPLPPVRPFTSRR